MKHGLLTGYAAPEVTDYGNLVEITAAVHVLMGASDVSDLSFSGSLTPGAGGQLGTVAQSSPTGAQETSTGDSGDLAGGSHGGSGGSSGGGSQLPFTGFAAGAAAAIGSALAAGGAALRRASGGRRRP